METKFMAAWGASVALGSLACASTTSVVDYQIEQKALVPTNAAPRAMGPLAGAQGEFGYVEGGVQVGVVEQAGAQEARLLGHDIPLVQGNARAAYAATQDVELGVSARYANSWVAASSARAPREVELENAHTAGVGVQARVRVAGGERLGLVLGTEVGVDVIPMRRDVYTNRTDIIERPGSDWVVEYPEQQDSIDLVDVNGVFAGQLSVQGSPLAGASAEVGVRVSTQPKYFGAMNVAEVCEEYAGSRTCEGRSPSDVPRSTLEAQGTLFGGAMFEVVEGEWSVGGKAWWTPWGPQSLARASPGGGELTVRVHLR